MFIVLSRIWLNNVNKLKSKYLLSTLFSGNVVHIRRQLFFPVTICKFRRHFSRRDTKTNISDEKHQVTDYGINVRSVNILSLGHKKVKFKTTTKVEKKPNYLN